MKKYFIIGLLALIGFSNTSIAAPTSLTVNGTWDTATGDLSYLLGQSAPATWSYERDLATALAGGVPSGGALPSGGTYLGVNSSLFTLSGTASPLFDNLPFSYTLLNNSVAAIDSGQPYSADLQAKMTSHGLDINKKGDVVLFNVAASIAATSSTNAQTYSLTGLMIFDEDFLTPGPLLPSAEELLANTFFTYGHLLLTTTIPGGGLFNSSTTEVSFASFAQVPSAVPVPAALFMFAPALFGFIGLRRKAKNLAA